MYVISISANASPVKGCFYFAKCENLHGLVSGNAYIRLNPLQPLMKYHVVQHIYFFFLLALYGFSVVIQSLGERKGASLA